MNADPVAWRLRDWVVAAVFFVATAAFTLWQNAHVAVLWDISFFLDTAYRFSLHQVPYTKLPFPYPPLFFYLHTAIIEIFGRVYFPHVLFAVAEGAAAVVLTWRILLKVLRNLKLDAWAVAVFLTAPLIVLGIYGVYPHPIYDSDCIFVVLVAVYLLQQAEGSVGRNLLAGAVCVVPLFIKQNIGLAFLLTTVVSVAAVAVSCRLRRMSVMPQVCFFAGVAATLTAALLTIQLTVGLHNFLYWTITFAAQRRLPGPRVVLSAYRQSGLLWSLPAAVVGVGVLWMNSGPKSAGPWRRVAQGNLMAKWAAVLLLAAPFLWTMLSLARTVDSSDRADQFLSLWPHVLILGFVLALWELRPENLRADSSTAPFLPLILLATIHGTFLSQQLWGSTYAIWPLLTLLIAMLLRQVPSIARPMSAVVSITFLLCGGLYAASHDRLSYIKIDGMLAKPTLPELRGMSTPGPWIAGFEELVRFANAEIPANDGILVIPGEEPFYFATGRTPQFPILLFDPATDPYTADQTREEARQRNIRWLVVNRELQLSGLPHPGLPEITRAVEQDFTLYRKLGNYYIYRRK